MKGKTVYFIGGPSASGKTVIATVLSKKHGIPLMELDKVHDLLNGSIKDSHRSGVATARITETIIEELILNSSDCILEGGWIDPAKAHELRQRHGDHFYPVFCGYPRSEAGQRLFFIREWAGHWISQLPESEALEWLHKQINGSRWYQQECVKNQIPFFDFSKIGEGSAALALDFKNWWLKIITFFIALDPFLFC